MDFQGIFPPTGTAFGVFPPPAGGGGTQNPPYAPGYTFTVPLAASFTTLLNSATMTLTDKNFRLQAIVGSTTLKIWGGLKAVPATPYTIDLVGSNHSDADTADSSLLCLVSSDGTKLNMIMIGPNANKGNQATIQRWTNSTTFSSAPLAGADVGLNCGLLYLRMTNDGANTRQWLMSNNGLDFCLLWSELANAFLTETLVGVGFYNKSQSGNNGKFSIYHFGASAGVLGDAP